MIGNRCPVGGPGAAHDPHPYVAISVQMAKTPNFADPKISLYESPPALSGTMHVCRKCGASYITETEDR